MGKSEFKRLIFERYPEIKTPLPEGDVVIIDGLCDLQGIYPQENMRPIQLIQKFGAMIPIDARLTVFVFDKVSSVPKIKGIEQRQRSSAKRDTVHVDCDESTQFLELSNVITPDEWTNIIADRRARNWLIHELGMYFVDHYIPKKGTSLVLDGMVLDDEKLPILLEGETPQALFTETIEKRKVKRILRNNVGEADLSMKLYIQYALDEFEGPLRVQINTQDSDLIMILLIHYDALDEDDRKRLSLILKFGKQGPPGKKVHSWMDISMLWLKIKTDLTGLEHPIPYFCAMCMSAGNDYMDSFPSVNEERTFKVIFQDFSRIKDVFKKTSNGLWQMDWDAYMRMAFHLMIDYFNGGNKAKKISLRKRLEDCQWQDLVRLVKDRFTKDTQHVPTLEQMYLKFQRLQWNMLYILVGHLSEPEALDQSSMILGFTNEKPEEPLNFHNTKRQDKIVLTGTPQDHSIETFQKISSILPEFISRKRKRDSDQ